MQMSTWMSTKIIYVLGFHKKWVLILNLTCRNLEIIWDIQRRYSQTWAINLLNMLNDQTKTAQIPYSFKVYQPTAQKTASR